MNDLNKSAEYQVRAGMVFMPSGVKVEVVKPNEKIPGDWFCRSLECDTGLWSYSPKTIIETLVSDLP